MTAEQTFEKNLELWAHSHPREVIWLQYLESDNLEVCPAGGDAFNLKRCTGEREDLFYPNGSPLAEADQWAAGLDLAKTDVVYVFGIGLGYYYLSLKKWLKQDPERHLVFLEDDLEVISRFFETDLATQLLSDKQVSLFYFREASDSDMIFNQLYWNFPMARFQVEALGYYKECKKDKFDDLHHQLCYSAKVKDSLLQEYLEYGVAFYRNYYQNILHINEAYLGNALFGKFSGTPAIICGAGPSLEKNISLLKQLGNKAIIFAGSSALNALTAEGIRPHLGAGIDPNPMQEERLRHVRDLDFPFLYRNRLYPGARKLIKGPKLYITGSGGYDISEYFEGQFGIEGKFIEEGRNVVNFCLEAAYEMGCNPIIFVGLDLAYSGMKAYTSGVVEDPSVTRDTLRHVENFDEAGVVREDIHGKEVYTLWKWVSEAKWIGDFAVQHPEVTLVNATEGGLGFPGIPNRKLEEASREYLTKDFDLESMIVDAYSSRPLSDISDERVMEVIDKLRQSLSQCLEYLSGLEEENSKMMAKIGEEGRVEHSQTGRAVLLETELLEETAFVYVLQIFNDVCSRLVQKDVMRLYDPRNSASEVEKELEKLRLNSRKYQFLSRVGEANLKILEHAIARSADEHEDSEEKKHEDSEGSNAKTAKE